ncbi:MAG: methyl-accepting chemotaxis protein [Pseudomonadota bacterium]
MVKRNLLNLMMTPSSWLMARLHLKTKLIGLCLLYLVPIVFLSAQRFEQIRVIDSVLLTVLIFSLILLYFSFGFYRSFVAALKDVQRSATTTASGDLSQLVQVSGSDELAQTGKTLETMSINLSSLVASIRSDSVMVSQSGQHLASGLSALSSRTEQQASSLEQTTASVAELADTVKKNADSAKAVDSLAINVRMIAESSGDAMQSAVDSMKGIQVSALKVQDIVSVIDSIAFQTNILALNAAVEAARAGEQGRGFAVVAAEVRNLAQRSASSAKEIKHLIEDSVEKVGSGVTQIGLVSTTLGEIVSGIRELAGNVSAISSATAEQSHGLGQISLALKQLDELTQSNGQMAETALATSAALDQRAGKVAKSVASFKLRQGSADDAFALVKRGMALCKEKGRDALQLITSDKDHQFADRDMYVFVFDRQGIYRAFGGNEAKLGICLLNVPGLDGRKLVDDAFSAAANGGGWVDYSIVNPVTKKVESKTSYVERVTEQLVLGCGVYK